MGMMHMHRMVITLLWPLLLGGCHAVYSAQPVGDKPVVLVAGDWEGTWVHKDGAVTVAVVNPEKGVLEIGWVEKRQDRLVFERYQVLVRQSGQWLFGNVQDPDRPRLYVWGRLRNEDNRIVLWAPEVGKLKSLVERKIVRGSVTENGEDVILDGPDAAELQRLMRGTDGISLDWERPLVFSRQSR
jgi:hypothetical protein